MSEQINESMTVNDVIRRYPKTQQVMDRYHVDYCCGGFHTLAEAAKEGGFDLNAFLDDLRKALA